MSSMLLFLGFSRQWNANYFQVSLYHSNYIFMDTNIFINVGSYIYLAIGTVQQEILRLNVPFDQKWNAEKERKNRFASTSYEPTYWNCSANTFDWSIAHVCVCVVCCVHTVQCLIQVRYNFLWFIYQSMQCTVLFYDFDIDFSWNLCVLAWKGAAVLAVCQFILKQFDKFESHFFVHSLLTVVIIGCGARTVYWTHLMCICVFTFKNVHTNARHIMSMSSMSFQSDEMEVYTENNQNPLHVRYRILMATLRTATEEHRV